MPIKTLESFLFERKLVNTSSIEILLNATIGIDVEHYLSRIYTYKKEQFLFGIGGIPSSLNNYIQSDLNVFKEFNIRPIFVLPGLKINSQQNTYSTNELSPQEQHLETTWNKIYAKHSNVTNSGFVYINESFRMHFDPLPIRPMINDLVKYFIDNGIDYIVSPYDASFQLSYLYQNKLIDSIYASTDVLLTKIDKFILGMEFQSKDFRFVYKLKVLNDLNLTERQFLDLSIMVGCSAQPETFSNFPPMPKPNPMSPYPQMNYFRLALDLFFQYNAFSGGNAVDLFGYISGLGDPHLIELYFRGHAVLKYMPVLNSDGYVELYSVELSKLGLLDDKNIPDAIHNDGNSLTSADDEESLKPSNTKLIIPTEIHSIISQRLPPEIYLYQSLGLLPLKLLEAITLGKYCVRPPLEVGLGDAYKRLITSDRMMHTLDYQFNLITQLLARYYQGKRIEITYWFKDSKEELNNRLIPPLSVRLNPLRIVSEDLGPFSMSTFLKTFDGAIEDIKTPVPSKVNDLVSTALLRSFYLTGIVSDKKVSPAGSILARFAVAHPDIEDLKLQQMLLILLLLESEPDILFATDKLYPSVPKTFKDGGSDVDLSIEEVKQVTLLSRIFSIQKLNIHPINYQGPISRSLLYFRSTLKVLQDSMLSSLQVCLVDFIVRQDTIKSMFQSRDKWYQLIDQIPFFRDMNSTLLGVVCELFFDYCLKRSKSGQSAKDCSKGAKIYLLDSIFQVHNPSFNINLNSANSVTSEQLTEDLQHGVQFWKEFKHLAQLASEIEASIISKENLALILVADDLVNRFLPDQ